MSTKFGLSQAHAQAALTKDGLNQAKPAAKNSRLALLIRQFASPIILVLIAATVTSMFLGDLIDGIVILAIIIPSGLLSFWQEDRASKTMKLMTSRLQVQVRTWRDGQVVEVPITEIVVGDVVELSAGDIVPADAKVLVS